MNIVQILTDRLSYKNTVDNDKNEEILTLWHR